MTNPVLVEVTRGERVESRHSGAVAVCAADGRTVLEAGDVGARVFPRSAIKVFQAIPLVESGAADALGLGDRELALACASHSGEPGHVALAAAMLGRANLDAESLECGCHWPSERAVAFAMVRAGEALTPLHNNCSGKHAGFLCTAVHLGEEPRGYVAAAHPVQERARAAIADLTGSDLPDTDSGVDGCSIPTYAAPLRGFAHGFAKLAAGTGVSGERAESGRRLMAAAMREPWWTAGTGRACVALMEAAPGRVYAKTGAEGVFCGAIPELGLGFALKIDDGGTRAAECAVAATLARIFRLSEPALAMRYDALARHPLRNWEKVMVGEVRPVGPLAG